MREKPIIFSTPMVKAILEGRKTMTRRVVKELEGAPDNVICDKVGSIFEFYEPISHPIATRENVVSISPKYQLHDILWVRETWTDEKDDWIKTEHNYLFKADGPCVSRWRSSIFMPREAARLFLEVINISVERLNIISEEDAIKEGLPESVTGVSDYTQGCFRNLWDSLNAERGYSWDSNPWVWVIEFRIIKK